MTVADHDEQRRRPGRGRARRISPLVVTILGTLIVGLVLVVTARRRTAPARIVSASRATPSPTPAPTPEPPADTSPTPGSPQSGPTLPEEPTTEAPSDLTADREPTVTPEPTRVPRVRALPRRIPARGEVARPGDENESKRSPRTTRRAALAAGLLVVCAAASLVVSGLIPLSDQTSDQRDTDAAVAPVVATMVEEPPAPDCTVLRCVTLTFDDGPDRYSTPALLDVLEAKGVTANFFILGHLVEGNEDILLRMERLGMGVENHTWSHPDLSVMSADAVRDQLARTNAEIGRVLGYTPRYMRPPYGAWTPGSTPTGGMRPVLWEVDPQDWLYRNSAVVAENVANLAGPGDVILLHDIHQTSVDAVPTIIDTLHARGYTFVTLDDLFASREACPPQRYCAPHTTTATPSATTTAPAATRPSPVADHDRE